MSTNTTIEWATKTWGPVLGCKRVSKGCDGCYAIRTVHRLAHNPSEKVGPLYVGLTKRTDAGRLDWTGVVRTIPGRLGDPLGWRKPERIFVNSQSDLFHPAVPADFIAHVWATMAATPQHTYQILTKRPDVAAKVLSAPGFREAVVEHLLTDPLYLRPGMPAWPVPKDGLVLPLPNAWIGTSVEDQKTADERIEKLRRIPAAVHWISAEPLLEYARIAEWVDELDWVVAGGESGPAARPMHPAWARSLRDVCRAASVPFLFKQWGAWAEVATGDSRISDRWVNPDGTTVGVVTAHSGNVHPAAVVMRRGDKKANGRLLDGIEHNGYPREQVSS